MSSSCSSASTQIARSLTIFELLQESSSSLAPTAKASPSSSVVSLSDLSSDNSSVVTTSCTTPVKMEKVPLSKLMPLLFSFSKANLLQAPLIAKKIDTLIEGKELDFSSLSSKELIVLATTLKAQVNEFDLRYLFNAIEEALLANKAIAKLSGNELIYLFSTFIRVYAGSDMFIQALQDELTRDDKEKLYAAIQSKELRELLLDSTRQRSVGSFGSTAGLFIKGYLEFTHQDTA